jgi:hypothetical protein
MMHVLKIAWLLIPTIASTEECTYIDANGVTVAANADIEHAKSPFKSGSVGITHLLHFDTATNRPIWTKEIFDQFSRIIFREIRAFMTRLVPLIIHILSEIWKGL